MTISHLNEIKFHIRRMPYGDTMELARVVSEVNADSVAAALWKWANENKSP